MRRSERGFTLLEALFCIALTTGVLLAVGAAVGNSLHASANEATRIALRDDALSVLADVRAATAYDDALLRRTVGKTSTATLDRSRAGAAEMVTLSVERVVSGTHTNVVASASVTQNATTVTERTTLYVEAPAPGSTIDQ
ncbi:MAG: hypothetical protein NVSMB21_15870 [Vulcanimicrobiaceae bacterium]